MSNDSDQKLILMKAEQGDAQAQYAVGFYFLNGEGVSQDNKKAYEWFLKAAEQGYAPAQCNVGYLVQNGIGVEKDEKKAIEWFLKAAEQGEPQAQFNLGNCFYYGLGVEKDLQQTHEWYGKAAEQGNAEAQYGLGYFFTLGIGVKQDSKIAYEWLLKAAQQDHVDAQELINHTYWYSSGVKRSIKKVVDDQPGVETRDKKLTLEDAYDATYNFLRDYYDQQKKESLYMVILLGDMMLLPDGTSADSATKGEWLESVTIILNKSRPNDFKLSDDTFLSVSEAYDVMMHFVEDFANRLEADDIKELIGKMVLIKTEESTDSSMWKNWLDFVAKVLSHNPRQRPWFELLPKE